MGSQEEQKVINTDAWIEENKKDFLPPVCNKMLYKDGQMKAFFVGGPNQRRDYHIEAGEELFFMVKGDMCLKVVVNNKHQNIPIKQGEIFLLPARIAHSPQRQADTVGIVLERERSEDELDGLRYYQEKDGVPTLDTLFERWTHITDLGTQLGPIIKEYFASDEYKTGKPGPGAVHPNPPITLDSDRVLTAPFSLRAWLDTNKSEINKHGRLCMFPGDYQFKVWVFGEGEQTEQCDSAETFIWQLDGSSDVDTADIKYHLNEGDGLLIVKGCSFKVTQPARSLALVCYQDPTLKK